MESDGRHDGTENTNDAEPGSRDESTPIIQPGSVEDPQDSCPDAVPTPGGTDTIVPGTGPSGKPEEGPGTILVSSSSKARTQIEVCLRCKSDNPPGSRFCESCGADLNKEQDERAITESRERSEKYAKLAKRPLAGGHGQTILRKPGSSSARRQEADVVEKRSYHSQYLPPGASGRNLDHESYRSDVGPSPMQPIQQVRQLSRLPVDTVRQRTEEKQTSFVVGIAVAAVLFVVFAGLIAILIVLLLK